ncbi:uncharacterized protein N7473_006569 [Penicillium subrubescens]|uniref:uncharacterized protein n=1 Tax=Penicillium subrubescens TaxID=1316194 RepID=UPI0025451336|nr:uncharacterized protein N7473_006569 [Penicillium subrubescens]KAJ5890341.1 hypothetical protein N7473_006569 [Penicillium subrubescens]
MTLFRSSFFTLNFFVLLDHVQAATDFPVSLSEAHPELKKDYGVTFDPLGVAAILYNQRADRSAARLYTQYDRNLFIWPHMTMIGGTLPPMQMLVERLTAPFKWIHPAIKMCAKDTTMLPIRSDISGNVFRQLPYNLSNTWLSDIISFEPSEHPGNDFAIAYVDRVHQKPKKPKKTDKDANPAGEDHEEEILIRSEIGNVRWQAGRWTLNLLGIINGAMVLTGMVFGILLADIWAFTLFLLYSLHWGASVAISIDSMVTVHTPPRIVPESSDRFAVYEREEGGTVIFKGPQRTLETWARSTWEYDPSWDKDFRHWLWIITGSLSGIASVACMVNMQGRMQLVFLGVLVYASVAEIGATRIARILQTKAHGPIAQDFVRKNATRSLSIIQATLTVLPRCRLTGLDWIKMGLLPDMLVFREMQALLRDISQILGHDKEDSDPLAVTVRALDIKDRCLRFVDKVKTEDSARGPLAMRIYDEIYNQTLNLGEVLPPKEGNS